MTRKTRAGESCLSHAATEQLCAETLERFSNKRQLQPALPRDDIEIGGLAFTALGVFRDTEPPRDYAAENAKTKAKFFKRRFGKKTKKNYT
jgi:hypothetical protein